MACVGCFGIKPGSSRTSVLKSMESSLVKKDFYEYLEEYTFLLGHSI